MKIKNVMLAVFDWLTRSGGLRDIFITRTTFSVFNRYSHILKESGRPKKQYSSKAEAMKVAKSMAGRYEPHFYAYKCAWCDGWHIGKNVQNKELSQQYDNDITGFFQVHPNALYESLKHYPIADLAPVYGNGVRGRTMSGHGCLWLLDVVRNSGIKVIIDLRTADQTERYNRHVRASGMKYYSIPVDAKSTDVHQIISFLPLLFKLMDEGDFYMACAMGRHRTDIAIALYYVFHPTVPFEDVPEMRGHRKDGIFRCDDIAARLNSVIKSITVDEQIALGLPEDYMAEFVRRKETFI